MGGANPNANTNAGVSQYPVISSKDAGVDEYLKAHPEVSGMAWGAGLNGSSKDSPRSVVVNPYNTYLKTPQDTNNLIQNERIRHQMDETKWNSDFEITPEQQTWSQSLGEYATNPQKLRETIVARLASNEYVPSPTQQQKQLANNFMGGANIPQQQQMSPMMKKETMQEFTNSDGSKSTYGGDIPYYGDAKPMLVPSNYKPALEIIPKESMTERPMSEVMSPLDPTSIISDDQKEAATYARLKKQRMSDQGIVSLPELRKEVVGTAKELGAAINKKVIQPVILETANFFGRDASKPASADDEIEMGLRKSELRKK